MEFLTEPPAALPPALNQYSALAVLKLTPSSGTAGTGHPGHPLRRRSSLGLVASGGSTGFSGSLGASYGGGYGGGGEEAAAAGTEGRPVGGLRRILSRSGQQAHHRENSGGAAAAGGSAIDDSPGAALGPPSGGPGGKVGKWQAKVAVGTTPVSLFFPFSSFFSFFFGGGCTFVCFTFSGPTAFLRFWRLSRPLPLSLIHSFPSPLFFPRLLAFLFTLPFFTLPSSACLRHSGKKQWLG